jgi:hypothetical protein
MQEVWHPVKGWETRYEVSSFGRVRSLPLEVPNANGGGRHMRPGRILKEHVQKSNGYAFVGLRDGGRNATVTIHFLVAQAFLPPCPGKHGNRRGCWNIDHINEVKTDNRVENLRWLPRDENRRRSCTHLTPEDIKAIRWRRRAGEPGCGLAKEFGVSDVVICSIHKRTSWKWVD